MVLSHWKILTTLVSLLLSLSTSSLANSFPPQQPLSELTIRPTVSSELAKVHQFALRHILISGRETHKRFDIPRLLHERHESPVFIARSQSTRIQRLVDRQPSSVQSLLTSTQLQGHSLVSDEDAWILEHVAGPNISDRKTVINLAIMASDAYLPDTADPTWFNLTDGYNRSQSFGWQASGIRGHVFTDQDNSTIVIAIKGTEEAAFDGAGTSTKDKINDNLFFGCCCAQQGHFSWHQVCACATDTYQCDQNCLIRELISEDHYYRATLDLYSNITELYPHSNIWLVGHSLGGALSSLLGLTYGHPTVTFEAPPDALAAERLGLPLPPASRSHQTRSDTGAYHFGNTADPVFMGSCHSSYSLCSMWGYAFESQCHTGSRCVYDTIKDKGWWQSITHHGIDGVIKNVIEAYEGVPECKPEDVECQDCFNWRFDGTVTTTSTSLSTSAATSTSEPITRTETCKTPGWWHCLDRTTTSTSVSTTSLSTTATACHTPGWFGCKDPSPTSVIPTLGNTITTTPPGR